MRPCTWARRRSRLYNLRVGRLYSHRPRWLGQRSSASAKAASAEENVFETIEESHAGKVVDRRPRQGVRAEPSGRTAASRWTWRLSRCAAGAGNGTLPITPKGYRFSDGPSPPVASQPKKHRRAKVRAEVIRAVRDYFDTRLHRWIRRSSRRRLAKARPRFSRWTTSRTTKRT